MNAPRGSHAKARKTAMKDERDWRLDEPYATGTAIALSDRYRHGADEPLPGRR